MLFHAGGTVADHSKEEQTFAGKSGKSRKRKDKANFFMCHEQG